MEIGMFFPSLTLKNARKLGKLANFFGLLCEPRKGLGKMTKNCNQKFRNFPDKVWKFSWWSTNLDKTCQVVREPEKVENRCYREFMVTCIDLTKGLFG